MDFYGGFITNTARVDTLDQLTLPMDSSVDSLSVHIAYGDKYTVSFLLYMVRYGLWRIINRPISRKLDIRYFTILGKVAPTKFF